MRRRWEFDPAPFVMAWMFGGLVVFIIVMSIWNGCDQQGCGMDAGHISTVGIVGLCVWLGPIVLPLAGLALAAGAVGLWSARPRRLWEPVTTDLREADDD